jgi:hypothetical protein
MSKQQLVPKLQRHATKKSVSINAMEIYTDGLLSENEVVTGLQVLILTKLFLYKGWGGDEK